MSVFFEYALKEHRKKEEKRQLQGLEPKLMKCTIDATMALKIARNQAHFKFPSKLYKLFLTAAPVVVKNERSFSLMKMVKSYAHNKYREND